MTIAWSSIEPEQTVNEVIAQRPNTLAVFRSYGIDACCGGSLQIEEVCRRHGIDQIELLLRLEQQAE
jgi:regulator of cell morphogenesis and NO signaling